MHTSAFRLLRSNTTTSPQASDGPAPPDVHNLSTSSKAPKEWLDSSPSSTRLPHKGKNASGRPQVTRWPRSRSDMAMHRAQLLMNSNSKSAQCLGAWAPAGGASGRARDDFTTHCHTDISLTSESLTLVLSLLHCNIPKSPSDAHIPILAHRLAQDSPGCACKAKRSQHFSVALLPATTGYPPPSAVTELTEQYLQVSESLFKFETLLPSCAPAFSMRRRRCGSARSASGSSPWPSQTHTHNACDDGPAKPLLFMRSAR